MYKCNHDEDMIEWIWNSNNKDFEKTVEELS